MDERLERCPSWILRELNQSDKAVMKLSRIWALQNPLAAVDAKALGEGPMDNIYSDLSTMAQDLELIAARMRKVSLAFKTGADNGEH
jgi:hypothetical protein